MSTIITTPPKPSDAVKAYSVQNKNANFDKEDFAVVYVDVGLMTPLEGSFDRTRLLQQYPDYAQDISDRINSGDLELATDQEYKAIYKILLGWDPLPIVTTVQQALAGVLPKWEALNLALSNVKISPLNISEMTADKLAARITSSKSLTDAKQEEQKILNEIRALDNEALAKTTELQNQTEAVERAALISKLESELKTKVEEVTKVRKIRDAAMGTASLADDLNVIISNYNANYEASIPLADIKKFDTSPNRFDELNALQTRYETEVH